MDATWRSRNCSGIVRQHGSAHFSGEISNLLVTKQENFHPAKTDIYDAGLRDSPWQHLDATSTRVDGKNQYCHVVCNPLYTAYITTPQQDRLTVLSVLRNLREPVYRVNDEALSFLQQCGMSAAAIERVSRIQWGVDHRRGGMAAPGRGST